MDEVFRPQIEALGRAIKADKDVGRR